MWQPYELKLWIIDSADTLTFFRVMRQVLNDLYAAVYVYIS